MTHRVERARRAMMKTAPFLAVLALASACSDNGAEGTDSSADASRVEGTLETVVVGNAERTAAHLEFFVEDASGRWTRLLFDEHPEFIHDVDGHAHLIVPGHSHDELTGSVTLRVTGARTFDTLQVSSLEIIDPAPHDTASTEQALIASSPHKVAVILANFSNDTSQPITAAAARDMVFGSASSANAYYQSVSFGIRSLVGKLATSGDVFGWYTLAAKNDACDYASWGTAARAAAQAAGVDLSGYDHVIHYFPRAASCGWAGVGQVPGKYTWINGSNSQTVAHELGHNFGSHHASTLICTNSSGARVSISPTCTLNEYGNPFDVMGSGYHHLTAFNKG
ncbi:MAG TPA: zinc-dependent metalloprotease family protein, partial [Polyangiaceae bacterium]|nr:zinc-dependent metalloprotease family protein [Polyangiaceae bacterium]